MKAVLESLQSFLGLFFEDRKPSNTQKGYAGDPGYIGGYGFPLLIRRLKPKKGDREEKQLSRNGDRKSFSRRRVHSLSTLIDSEPNLSPSHGNLSPIKIISPPGPMAERIESLRIRDRSMGLRDCLVKMYSRRVAARKHADEPFDKCTSEYYSCGKKGVQNRRLACKFLFETGNVDYPDGVDVNAHASTSDSEVSESSCVEGNASTQGAQQIRLRGVPWKSAKNSSADYVEHGKVSGLSIILEENKAPSDDHNIEVEVQKMGVLPSVSTENGDHLHDRIGDCNAGFCSQHGYDEEDSSWQCGASALSLSPARGVLRKKFPPPLNMLAIHSYSDTRGLSPEACAAGYCLRSFRRDGRFVLQEVRAPSHKYFRVLREDGRLKLELVGDSSQEDEETSASDVCGGVKNPMVGVVTEVLYTSNTHVEDTCKGMSHVGVHALCGETNTRAGSNTGCVRTHRANAGVVKPLEHVVSAASDIQRKAEAKGETANISSDVGTSADEQIPHGNLISAKGVGADSMVSPLIESPSSPRCPEMRPLYDGSSASIKRSWVRPISAF